MSKRKGKGNYINQHIKHNLNAIKNAQANGRSSAAAFHGNVISHVGQQKGIKKDGRIIRPRNQRGQLGKEGVSCGVNSNWNREIKKRLHER